MRDNPRRAPKWAAGHALTRRSRKSHLRDLQAIGRCRFPVARIVQMPAGAAGIGTVKRAEVAREPRVSCLPESVARLPRSRIAHEILAEM